MNLNASHNFEFFPMIYIIQLIYEKILFREEYGVWVFLSPKVGVNALYTIVMPLGGALCPFVLSLHSSICPAWG